MVFRDVGFFDVVIVVGFSVLGKVDFPLAKSVGFTVGIVSFDFPLDKSVGFTVGIVSFNFPLAKSVGFPVGIVSFDFPLAKSVVFPVGIVSFYFPLAKSVGFPVGIISFDFPMDKSVGFPVGIVSCLVVLRIVELSVGILFSNTFGMGTPIGKQQQVPEMGCWSGLQGVSQVTPVQF